LDPTKLEAIAKCFSEEDGKTMETLLRWKAEMLDEVLTTNEKITEAITDHQLIA
jgi:hypothetical protein